MVTDVHAEMVYRPRISIHTTTQVVTGQAGRGDHAVDISIHTTTQVVTVMMAESIMHPQISIHTTTQVVTVQ